MFDENKKKLNLHAMLAILFSVVLGVLYTYLFCWYEVGIAHLVFYVAYVLLAIVGAVMVDKQESARRISGWVIVLFLSLILSASFLYRLNPLAIFLTSLSLPVLYGILLTLVFNPDMAKPAGLFSFLKAPFLIFASWFMEIPTFFKSISFRFVKSEKSRSLLTRTFKGCAVALPFMFVFVVLLSSADLVFQKFVSDLFGNMFAWINDFGQFISFVGKMIVGGVVSIYTMVYFFSLWNHDSQLAKLAKYEEPKEPNKSAKTWDALTSSVFLGALNLIFVTFVLIQLRYLFGGNENVIGQNAGFTYADYARRGFFELLFVTGTVFLITLVLNARVFTANMVQKLAFRINFVLLVVCAIVLTLSALSRITLYESVYGFTILRVFVTYLIVVIGLLFVLLLISALLKKSTKFMSISSLIIIVSSFVIWSMIPTDLVVARLNADRYFQTGRLDMEYILTLSDEANSAIVDLADDSRTSLPAKHVLQAALADRYNALKEKRKGWQELNFVDQYNKLALAKYATGGTRSDANEAIENDVKEVLSEYESLLKAGKFDEAFSKYWSAGSKKQDLSQLQITITGYSSNLQDYGVMYDTDNSYAYSYGHSYFSRSESMKLYFYDARKNAGTSKLVGEQCRYDYLEMVLEGGEWKIKSASMLELGYPQYDSYGYENNGSYDRTTPFYSLYQSYSSCNSDYELELYDY